MMIHERLKGETAEQFIQRRAQEIHLEEAYINDPFISDEQRAYRAAKASGLIALDMLDSEE
jgi:hypothetical protein